MESSEVCLHRTEATFHNERSLDFFNLFQLASTLSNLKLQLLEKIWDSAYSAASSSQIGNQIL